MNHAEHVHILKARFDQHNELLVASLIMVFMMVVGFFLWHFGLF